MTGQTITLYRGGQEPCSYLPDRAASNVYADPQYLDLKTLYQQLIQQGFRRSGEYIYRPGCSDCRACVPVRVLCARHRLRRVDRRNLKKNADLTIRIVPAQCTDEYLDLYCRYLDARHPGGSMANPDADQFNKFLLKPWGETLFVEVRHGTECIAVAATDVVGDALSAVYTFFDPQATARGLGRFCILKQIELCRTLGMPHLYLGYWVDGCRKMAYKSEYCPHQQFDGKKWVDVGQA